MKKRTIISIGIFLLIGFLFLFVYKSNNVYFSPENYSIEYLNSCSVLDSPNTLYIIQNNINSNSGCFLVNADNITLEGNNKLVIYTPNHSEGGIRHGITNIGYNNFVARNIEFRSSLKEDRIFDWENTFGNKIENVKANGYFYFFNVSNNLIFDNELKNYFWIDTSFNNTFNSNKMNGLILKRSDSDSFVSNLVNPIHIYSESLSVRDSINTLFLFNVINSPRSEQSAIRVDNSENINFFSNNVSCISSGYTCIRFIAATNLNLTSNNIHSKLEGISIALSSNSFVLDNNIFGNTLPGFSTGITIWNSSNNFLFSNKLNGISITFSENNTLFNNTVVYPGYDQYPGMGIYIYKSNFNNISSNNISYSPSGKNNYGGLFILNSSFGNVFSNSIWVNYGPAIGINQADNYTFFNNNLSSINSIISNYGIKTKNNYTQGVPYSTATFSMIDSSNNNFVSNIVKGSSSDSIRLIFSSKNLFENNLFESSTNYSVILFPCSYDNFFIENYLNFSNSKDFYYNDVCSQNNFYINNSFENRSTLNNILSINPLNFLSFPSEKMGVHHHNSYLVSNTEDYFVFGSRVFKKNSTGGLDFLNRILPRNPYGCGGQPYPLFSDVAIYGEDILAGMPLQNFERWTSDGLQRICQFGATYVFKINSTDHFQETQFLTSKDFQSGDYFGSSVSLFGDYAVIGAPGAKINGIEKGAAYVFKKNQDGNFVELMKLIPKDSKKYDNFGISVSIFGDYILVGATRVWYSGPSERDNRYDPGKVYIFKKNFTGYFEEIQSIQGIDQNKIRFTPKYDSEFDDYFGSSVSLFGDYAVVGAPNHPGSVYIYKKNSSDFFELKNKISSHSGFGSNVAISGDYLFVSGAGTISILDNGTTKFKNYSHVYLFKINSTGDFEEIQNQFIDNPKYSLKDISLFGNYASFGGSFLDYASGNNYSSLFNFFNISENKLFNEIMLCGNNLLEEGEECDDGNLNSFDGCSDKCLIDVDSLSEIYSSENLQENISCGNNLIDESEECDDGNILNGDGCSELCMIENNYTCFGEPSICNLIEPIKNFVDKKVLNNSLVQVEFFNEIEFPSNKVSLLEFNTQFFNYKVYINTSVLTEFDNVSAKVIFKNVSFVNPQIYYNGSLCLESRCKILDYNLTSREFIFNISGFSEYELVEGPYCGDGVCNGGETCSSCPSDNCVCSPVTYSGGGGSSGGIPRKCVSEWNCSWESCLEGIQEYTCIDLNDCGILEGKPEEIFKICGSLNLEDVNIEGSIEDSGNSLEDRDLSSLIVLGLIALIVCLILLIRYLKKINYF